MNSDKKLAERMKKGNEKAFEEIIYRFTPLVSNIIRNISSGYLSNEDIEEVTTDVFVTLWKNSEKLDVNMLKPYIICIAKSRVKDRLRRENKFGIVDIDSVDIADDGDIFEKYENESLVSDLKEEISKLKEPDKEILIRYYYYYQPVKEISEIMGINIETVKSKLQRTRKKLKEELIRRGY
ncbi:MAG: sigma-70 family RNA polymerase sigma factor [Clostridia bacterium]|nr:sigma-70 family RNA polymerase sigma factor [Clostridia bacterium]